MKTNTFSLIALIAVLLLIIGMSKNVKAQGNTWKLGGNNIGSNDYIGSNNNADFKIFSNNQLRINIGKDGTTEFFGKVKMTMDSVTLDFFDIKGLLKTDSLHVMNQIRIGSHSMFLGTNLSTTGADEIKSTGGQIAFGGTDNSGVPFTSNIKVGIGTNNPQSKLNISSTSSGEVFRTDGPSLNFNAWRLFTGSINNPQDPAYEKGMIFNWGNNPTIEDHSNFSIQASMRDMTFHTQPKNIDGIGKERMRIVGVPRFFGSANYIVRDGNVGIGTKNPLAKLHIGYDAYSSGVDGSGYRDWMDIGILMYGSQIGNL